MHNFQGNAYAVLKELLILLELHRPGYFFYFQLLAA